MPAAYLRHHPGLLALLAAAGLLRLLCFAWLDSRHSLQMDFAGLYSAGASLNAGLDPYKNNIDTDPRTWDGVAGYRHSRYLYTPLCAVALRTIAAMSYPVAKTVWTFGSLALIACSVVLALRIARVRLDRAQAAMLILIGSLIYPMIIFLERGQIDAVTLFIIFLGFELILRRKRPLAGGLVLALAGFIKLQCFYLLPLLLAVRMFRPALGMMLGVLLLLGAQGVLCGWPMTKQYFTTELPRIAQYGETGPVEWRLKSPAIEAIAQRAGAGWTLQGGTHPYRLALTEVAGLPSLTPYVKGALKAVKAPIPMSAVSVALLLGFCALLRLRLPRRLGEDGWTHLALVCLFMLVVMLAAPITWIMNLVWIVPASVLILFAPEERISGRGAGLARAAAWLGMALLLIPDGLSFPYLLPRVGPLAGDRVFEAVMGAHYAIALLCLLPLAIRIIRSGGSDADAPGRQDINDLPGARVP